MQLAHALQGLPNVVGYDLLNEPLEGYIGLPDLERMVTTIEKGAIPTPFQSMLLAAGIPQEVGIWERTLRGPGCSKKSCSTPRDSAPTGTASSPSGSGTACGASTGHGQPRLLRPDYFARMNGREVDFNRDYYIPFNNRFAAAIRQVHPEAILFVEHGYREVGPAWRAGDAPNIVYSPHFYDPIVLVLKTYNSWVSYDRVTNRLVLGPRAIRRSFAEQLRRPKLHAAQKMGNIPTLIGEVGICYDLDHKRAYRTGDFSSQVKAYERTLRALDDNLLSYTLWNYTADNTNLHGDQWNDEDFSIFSRDQQVEYSRPSDPADIHSGGRALQAVVRPYPLATAGEPLLISFDIRKKVYTYRFRHDPAVSAPTLVFVPNYQYPGGARVTVSDGDFSLDRQAQVITYRHSLVQEVHTIQIEPARSRGNNQEE